MSNDSRVQAVVEAMDADINAYVEGKHQNPPNNERMAAVAVAALDAYDAPKFSSVVHDCCLRPTEADLRERIAAAIEAEANVQYEGGAGTNTEYGRGVADGMESAARIARGQS